MNVKVWYQAVVIYFKILSFLVLTDWGKHRKTPQPM